jgi:hypothetical protein
VLVRVPRGARVRGGALLLVGRRGAVRLFGAAVERTR